MNRIGQTILGMMLGMVVLIFAFPWIAGFGSMGNWYGKYVIWVLRVIQTNL